MEAGITKHEFCTFCSKNETCSIKHEVEFCINCKKGQKCNKDGSFCGAGHSIVGKCKEFSQRKPDHITIIENN